MNNCLHLNFKANFGYGDFISNLAYAYNASIKYKVRVNATFHWEHSRNFKHHIDDPETIIDRFYAIKEDITPNKNCYIAVKSNSKVDYRYINNLDYKNPIHAYYSSKRPITNNGHILLWRSTFNSYFPGYEKDPLYNDWEDLINFCEKNGYSVKEVTYRTPVREVLDLISKCDMGIGYDGMIHQLFKIYKKPLIVFCKRYTLNRYLVPHAALENSFENFKKNGIDYYRFMSKKRLKKTIKDYYAWLAETQNPLDHPLFNKKVSCQ